MLGITKEVVAELCRPAEALALPVVEQVRQVLESAGRENSPSIKPFGGLLVGPALSGKSQVLRFLLDANPPDPGPPWRFIDAATGIRLPELVELVRAAAAERQPVAIDHLDCLTFPEGGTAFFHRALTAGCPVVLATSRIPAESIERHPTFDTIRGFRRFAVYGYGWVKPDKAMEAIRAWPVESARSEAIAAWAGRYGFHWRALRLVAEGKEDQADMALRHGLRAVSQDVANPDIYDAATRAHLTKRHVISGDLPKELARLFAEVNAGQSVLDPDVPTGLCGIDSDEPLHRHRVASEDDLQRLQQQLNEHRERCGTCRKALDSPELGPLVTTLAQAKWDPGDQARLEAAAWALKEWIRGLRTGVISQRLLERALLHWAGLRVESLTAVPETSAFTATVPVIILGRLVRALLNGGDGNGRYAGQALTFPTGPQWRLEVRGGPVEMLPAPDGIGELRRALREFLEWVEIPAHSATIGFEFDSGRRVLSFTFKAGA
jgi:hypothetical protein